MGLRYFQGGGVQKLSEGVDKFFFRREGGLRYFQKSFMGG